VSCGLSGDTKEMCAPSGEAGISAKLVVGSGGASISVRYYATLGSGGKITILDREYGGFDGISVEQDWQTLSTPDAVGVCSFVGDTGIAFTSIDFKPDPSWLTGSSHSDSATLPGGKCVSGGGFSACYDGSWADGISDSWDAVASNMPEFKLSGPSGWTISSKFSSVCSSLSF